MTMYRMRQRQGVLSVLSASLGLRRDAGRRWPGSTARPSSRSTRTPSRRSRPPSRTTCSRSSSSWSATRPACAPPSRSTNRSPLGACAITGTGFPIDRDLTSRLLGFDGPTGNTYGSIATVDYLLRERHGRRRPADRPGPLRPGHAAVVHGRVRLPAPGRRLRAGQQHHAAEAEPGGARARARDRQQGPRRGDGHRAWRSTTRRSATSSTPKTTCSRSWSGCSTMRPGRSTLVSARDGQRGVRRGRPRTPGRRRMDHDHGTGRHARARPRVVVRRGARRRQARGRGAGRATRRPR